MTHVAPRESWSRPPESIAYFCNVLRESPSTPSALDWHSKGRGRTPAPSMVASARAFVADEECHVRANAIKFLNDDIRHLWPAAHTGAPAGAQTHAHARRSEFRWNVLHAEPRSPEPAASDAAFGTQFWKANVRPSDRYSQALPGSTEFRISPLDRTYDNMTVAGDWTSCGLNMGCVEAAVMSGLLASHAIAQSPPLSEIVGYDHP
jgi:hypothetical protein